ncbi:MAG: START-like domain-containing protein [Bacteroidota bacterium]
MSKKIKSKYNKKKSFTQKKKITSAKSDSRKKTTTQILAANKKQKNEAEKNMIVFEYIFRTSSDLLFSFISSPSGLSEWFADDVNINGNIYTFFWDGSQQQAKMVNIKEGKSIRFQWLDKSEFTFFELRIEKNDLTDDISLMITDFAENERDKETLSLIWENQVHKLMMLMGTEI